MRGYGVRHALVGTHCLTESRTETASNALTSLVSTKTTQTTTASKALTSLGSRASLRSSLVRLRSLAPVLASAGFPERGSPFQSARIRRCQLSPGPVVSTDFASGDVGCLRNRFPGGLKGRGPLACAELPLSERAERARICRSAHASGPRAFWFSAILAPIPASGPRAFEVSAVRVRATT